MVEPEKKEDEHISKSVQDAISRLKQVMEERRAREAQQAEQEEKEEEWVIRIIWIIITLPFRILGWIIGIKRPAPPPVKEDTEDDLEDFLDFMEEYEYFEGEE